jgi:hypothetical protein
MTTESSTTVTHFYSRDGRNWTLCYDTDIPAALADGYLVERLTLTRTKTKERITRWTDT